MILESIEVNNFRNLTGGIVCGSGLNIIWGNNGQGKTNWLEAIYTLGRTKSFRTQHLHESIKFGADFATVRGRVGRATDIHRELQVTINGKTRSITINGKREPLTRYLTELHVVAFTAEELEVVRGMPDARRRFIDRGAASLQPSYAQTLLDYNKVIKQKNRILQDCSDSEFSVAETDDLVAPWNSQLVGLAGNIHRSRLDYVERLNQVLERRVFAQEEVLLCYVSSLDGKGDLNDYEGLIAERLRLRLPAEIAAGRSLIGPHRDELAILFDGRELRVYGSAGQQRSALLLLDLAAISLYNSTHDDYPLFLIDDVDAELDESRINSLLEYLEGRTQTFITTSKLHHVGAFVSGAEFFSIEGGAVVASKGEQQSVPNACGDGRRSTTNTLSVNEKVISNSEI